MAVQQYSFDVDFFGTAAPQVNPQQRPDKGPNLVEKPVKSSRKIKIEERFSLLHVATVIVLAFVFVASIASVISFRIKLMEAETTGQEYSEKLDVAQGENVRLMNELSMLVSDEKVEEYAVNTLGMKKLERYQIHYFPNESTDEAVIVQAD